MMPFSFRDDTRSCYQSASIVFNEAPESFHSRSGESGSICHLTVGVMIETIIISFKRNLFIAVVVMNFENVNFYVQSPSCLF